MVHRLLLAAAVVAAAAAVGEYKMVLQGCGCGDPVQTYNTTTAAFCPTSQYPSCNISKMSVSDNTCSFSCTGPRSRLVYRNNSVVWLATTSISCEKNADGVTGTLKNSEGEMLYNVLRPTCAYKAACDACSITYQPTCPTGMTCKEANMERTTGSDDCSQLACKDGTLNLYTSNGAPMPYIARKLLCTVVGKWTNYSIDGSIVGGTLINETISANCVLPKTCEECVDPNWTANLAALPTPFRTGYVVIAGSRSKEAGSCSEFTCPTGYTLYGFSGTSTAVTGLEYTSKGKLRCSGTSQWTNGGVENIPSNMLAACLKVIPPCQKCASNLIAVTQIVAGSKPMDGDVTTTTGSCAVRTFTCRARPAMIEIYGVDGKSLGVVDDGGTGTATFNVSCNAAGTAWEAAGLKIGRVECLGKPACQRCESNLIAVTTNSSKAKKMDSDVTSITDGCAERMFTCTGNFATMELWGENLQYWGVVEDGGTGSADLNVFCNAAGTAWEAYGFVVERLECTYTPLSFTCDPDLIDVTTNGIESIPMTNDVTTAEEDGIMRTFTCTGNKARIELFGEDGDFWGVAGDRGTGTATFRAFCNAAGTAWEEAEGRVITRVECTNTPSCKSCASNLIAVTQTSPGAKQMDGDVVSTVNNCAQRTFTCKGKKARIEMWTADGDSLGPIIEDGSGSVTLTVSCNAAGAAWETEGYAISRVECATPPACQTCAASLIESIPSSPGAKPIDGDDIAIVNGCSVRTFTCVGNKATIDYWAGGLARDSVYDEGTGTAKYYASCNAAGTVWEEKGGLAVSRVQCIAFPPDCNACVANQLEVTTLGANAKMMDRDETWTENGCGYRVFSCFGKDAAIEMWTWDPQSGQVSLGKKQEEDSDAVFDSVACRVGGNWVADRAGAYVKVVRVECTADCKYCDPAQISISQSHADAKPMSGDETVVKQGACAERTFTCTGLNATITVWALKQSLTIGDGGTGVATYTTECSGTVWRGPDYLDAGFITKVECRHQS